jgi:flotillin
VFIFYRLISRKLVRNKSLGMPCIPFFRVADPNEVIVVTGAGINDILITKKKLLLPGQKAKFIDLNPRTFTHDFSAMSKEASSFRIPITFTVGPTDPQSDVDGFLNYIRRLSNLNEKQIERIVATVAHGHVRELCQQRTLKDLVEGRLGFKDNLMEKTRLGLDRFGLSVDNINIGEIKDINKEAIMITDERDEITPQN